MKNIIRFAVRNPVTVCMFVLALMLLGKISYDRLSVDLLPDLNNPRLFIELKAGEKPPEEIEKLFVKNIESLAVRQSDVLQVSSVVKSGSAQITVEYAWDKDMDEAFLDLQKSVNPLTANKEISELKITQHDPNLEPVVLIAMSHDNVSDMAELRRIAENFIRNELIRLEGVAEVALSGEEEISLKIETNPYKLDAFGLRVDDIASRISGNNQNISGGSVTDMGIRYLVKSASTLTNIADFENLIVGYKAVALKDSTSAPIYLKEVATVKFENLRPDNIVSLNGERCIGLSIHKELTYNTVKVVEAVTKRLREIQQSLPGYRFTVISNQGTFIKQAITELQKSALVGILLAVIVLFVFLRRIGTTVIVSLAIPISIITTFNLMFFNGLTLNIMTLGGLALGAGMLIDNAIVVIESIFQHRERGESVEDAAVSGAAEVSGAVIASTLTTIVVFLPIVYLHGATGELFKDMAWTVTFSLVSSLVVALFVIPMFYKMMNRRTPIAANTGISDAGISDTPMQADYGDKTGSEPASIHITGYSRLLRRLLAMRWIVVGVAVTLIALAGLMVNHIGTEFMPHTEGKTFSLQVKMPEGTRLERTAAAAASIESLLKEMTGDSAMTVYSHVGEGSGSEDAIFEGEHTAMLKVILSPACQVPTEDVITQIIETAGNSEGMELSVKQDDNSMGSMLGSEGAPIVVEVKGEELDELNRLTKEVKSRMEGVMGIYNLKTSTEDGAPEITISLNRTMTGINNLTVATIVAQLKQQLSGSDAGQMEYRGEMRSIVIRTPDVMLSDLKNLIIKNGNKAFRLQEIAYLNETQAPKEIFRRNQSRISRVMADIDADKSLDKAADDVRRALVGIELPNNYSIVVTGEEEKRQESMNSLMFALLLSIVLVYMVMASQFESLLHPFTILLTIPLAVVGAVFLFFITGKTVNMMGVIGVVMLVGIAVNNSILLVDRINQLKLAGRPLADAIVAAGQQRIRPILMTSLTTILALLPMTFAIGEGSALRSPMAIAVVGGLVTSTIMSLVVIPCVYYLLETAKQKLSRRR